MKFAFCFGNGRSRIGIDPAKYADYGPTYGTNYMIKDFSLDNTIVADKQLIIELLSNGYQNKTNLYTRKRWKDTIKEERLQELPNPIGKPEHRWDNEIHWGSGCHAVNLAASHKANVIVMLGYDLWSLNGKENNIYSDKKPVDPSAWIHQLNLCFAKYPNVQFVQIQPDKWRTPEEWTIHSNYHTDSITNLDTIIKI